MLYFLCDNFDCIYFIHRVMKELSGSSVINVGVDQEEQRNHKEKESNVTSPSHFTCPKSKQITILLMICWYVCTWHIAVELGAVLWCDCYQMVLLCFSIWLRFSCSSIYYGITIALQHSSIRHYGNLECVLSIWMEIPGFLLSKFFISK